MYRTDLAARAHVTFGEPVAQRDLVPVRLEAPDESSIVAAPAYSSIRARATRFADEHRLRSCEVERLFLLASVSATNRHIDGLVLDDQTLSRSPLRRELRGGVFRASEAAALVGLCMRAHGDFAVSRDAGITRVIAAETFYRAVSFQHVSMLETWMSAAVTRWHLGDHRSLTLVDGIATRIGRALRARDYLQVRLRAPDYEAVWDEVLFFFDVILVQVMGAFDLLARLLHRVYGLNGPGTRASWTRHGNGSWLQALAKEEPLIGACAQPEGALGDIVALISGLRNRIHEEPLSDELHHWDGSPGIMVWGRGLVALRFDKSTQGILAAAERRGGLRAWGLRERAGEQAVVFDPGLYAEEALRSSTTAISDVLALANLSTFATDTSNDVSYWVPEQADRENAEMLFGLGHGGLQQDRVTSG